MKLIIVVLVMVGLTTLTPESCEGYRILGVFPFVGKSHFIMFEALMKGLARKGHQVDVVSTFPQKNPIPNYTDIIDLPLAMPALVNDMTYQRLLAIHSKIQIRWVTMDVGNAHCASLGHPEMQKIIKNPPKDPPYDLVITEFFVTNCFIALGRSLNVPTIGIISSALYPFNHRIIANPANLAFVPNNSIDVAAPMNFWQRFYNTVNTIFNDLYFQYLSRPQDEMIKKYFGEDTPGVREIERDVALVLANSHPSINGPRPVTSALIEVGGLHIQDDGPELPHDLKEWMDNSIDGFVYFTLGSMLKIESFPEDVLRVFYKSLGKIAPIRVLMKVVNPEQLPIGLPKNVRTFTWASQYKVLKHKNVKAFITQGGLMSTQEAIYYAVPMIGIPLLADQWTNVNLCVNKKIAIKLYVDDITEKSMDEALNKILHEPLYKKRALEISKQFRDRPMSPLDTAMWWVEHVIRHGGEHLRSPALDLNWWQIELLDVYAVILLIIVFFAYAIISLIRFIVKKIILIGFSDRVTHAKKVR